MFRSFFLSRRWFVWSCLGSVLIMLSLYYKTKLDVEINDWFGVFYNMVQQALTTPHSVTLDAFMASLYDFARIAAIIILVSVLLEFFVKHFVFKWRTAMTDYYTQHWPQLRHIEGAAQRVQEDTMRFARITESLGMAFINSMMLLAAYLPIMWSLSKHVTELPYFGKVEHAMFFVALVSASFGTVLLAVVGIKLPGLEFNNQRVEAAYRKELVLGEDNPQAASEPTLNALFEHVRVNYFRLYLHYLYFDIARWSYLQFAVIIPYLAMAPTIIAGSITLGVMNQILRAFGKVESSLQYLVNSWSTIIELISIYKRLSAFERQLKHPS